MMQYLSKMQKLQELLLSLLVQNLNQVYLVILPSSCFVDKGPRVNNTQSYLDL